MRRLAMVALAAAFGVTTIAPAFAAPIVGGRPATREYAFMVSLREKGGDHFCGGSLIRRNVVLTAAHCAEDSEPKALQIMVGSHKLSEPGPLIGVKKITIHPRYGADGSHDAALLRLKRKVRQKPIRIAGLGERDLWAPGTPATVIGWGQDNFVVGATPDELHEVEVPIVSDGDCARSYGNPLFGFDPVSMVCAGEDTGGKDSCQGDSGGPLMVEDARGRLVQVGVVSFGLGCGFPAFYGVYSRVADTSLYDWIAGNI